LDREDGLAPFMIVGTPASAWATEEEDEAVVAKKKRS
jgi:hypothetical protein